MSLLRYQCLTIPDYPEPFRYALESNSDQARELAYWLHLGLADSEAFYGYKHDTRALLNDAWRYRIRPKRARAANRARIERERIRSAQGSVGSVRLNSEEKKG